MKDTLFKGASVLALAMALCAAAVSASAVEVRGKGGAARWFEEMVEMPDGVRLYTFGTAPADGGKCPIIVMRNPYVQEKPVNVAAWAESSGPAMARGYAYVIQHCRGCGLSEGDWVPYENERADGLALLEYIRRLPWYNGEIFLEGSSYLATVHWTYLDTNPPDVKGAALYVQDVNRYNIAYRNGFFKSGLHGGWFVGGYKKKNKTLQRDKSVTFAQFPLADFPRRYWGEEVPALANELTHPKADDPFWSSSAPGSGADCRNALLKSTMPVLLKTSFYDIYTEGIFDMWREIPAERRAVCALIVDAYDHGGRLGKSMAGTRGEFPGGARADGGAEALDWFDSIRRGIGCTNAPPGKTRYYALWENAWHEVDALEDGPREIRLPIGTGVRDYVYDPTRPAPVFPGSGGICFGGMQLQPEPDFRDDVVSFVLPPVRERIDVRGRMEASLAVESDCEDTCFYVRVSVDKGDGRWYLLRDDITSLAAKRPYSPGEKRRLAFRFADHAFRLEPGDRLRVDVASASSQFAPHPNVAGDAFAARTPRTAHNRVYAAESELILQNW